ncbi:OmpA family protein [Alphaproteobacteria bacterium KMM 3653]|uniref:OmpA family protein n=1 Tax=Harenicola maris TaxID=2841044 RepID=A0AAP2CSG9_9RHOB|nr:OmpA family protein [Harenicola maris]
MRKQLGAAVGIVGVGLLGLYASGNPAKRIEAEIDAAAGAVQGTSVHGLKADVSGRDIALTGIADTEAERDAMLAALNDVPGRRVVRDMTTVLPVAAPFAMTVEKTGDGMVTSGHVPTEALRRALSGPLGEAGVGALTLSSGAPEGWAEAAGAGVETLTPLINGKLEMSDGRVALSGLALSPVEAAMAEAPLEGLPEGFEALVDLTLLDDGKPFALDVSSTDGAAVWNGGKLPAVMPAEALGAAFGSPVEGEPEIAKIGEDELHWPLAASQSLKALAALKSGQLRIEDKAVALTGLAADPATAEAVETAMRELPEGFRAEVALEVEDDGKPFGLMLTSKAGVFTGAGKLPAVLSRETLVGLTGAPIEGEITDARIGHDEEDFGTAVAAGVAALKTLESGSLDLSEDRAVLSGFAANPDAAAAAEEALSDLPQAFEAVVEIELIDDGEPMDLTVLKDPSGLTATGKVPAALDGFAYGEDVATDELTVAKIGADNAGFVARTPAGLNALREMEAGVLHVTDEGVSLSGAVLNPEAEARVRQALAGLEGDAPVIELDVLDDGTPMSVVVTKADGAMSAAGKVPAAMEGFAYGEGVDSAAVTVARIGAEDTQVAALTQVGLEALAQLNTGVATVRDGTLTVTGEANTQAESDAVAAALAAVEGSTFDLAVLDDGAPVAFEVAYAAESGMAVSGKLPMGVAPGDFAAASGLEAASGTPAVSGLSDAGGQGALDALGAAAPWLPVTESLRVVQAAEGAPEVTMVLSPGADAELVQAAMAEALGNSASVSVSAAEPAAEGAERVNAATGEAQVALGGAWLPVVGFDPSAQVCQEQSELALSESSLNFLSGSARLDGQAIRAINRLTAIARQCFTLDDLALEIGGHTDNQGDEASNYALSQQRAEAVVAALTARGVGGARITAQGFGPSQPVADNATAEGRAANRRTTIAWSVIGEPPEGAATEETTGEENDGAAIEDDAATETAEE